MLMTIVIITPPRMIVRMLTIRAKKAQARNPTKSFAIKFEQN